MINIFELNDKIRNYKYPIVKVIICSLIIAILFNRYKIISISNKIEDLIISIISAIIGFGCILSICISIIEMIELYDRCIDKKESSLELSTTIYSVDEILDIVQNNDIIEIKLKTSQGIIKLGSSSDNKWSENIFFDKIYYFDDKEYKTIEELKTNIMLLDINETVEVVSIDGIVEE